MRVHDKSKSFLDRFLKLEKFRRRKSLLPDRWTKTSFLFRSVVRRYPSLSLSILNRKHLTTIVVRLIPRILCNFGPRPRPDPNSPLSRAGLFRWPCPVLSASIVSDGRFVAPLSIFFVFWVVYSVSKMYSDRSSDPSDLPRQ